MGLEIPEIVLYNRARNRKRNGFRLYFLYSSSGRGGLNAPPPLCCGTANEKLKPFEGEKGTIWILAAFSTAKH
nr:MAG TPA: hypothetical protein [Caudoviricetes sp.]